MFRKFKKEKSRVLTKKYRKEKGQSLVEFAVILPVLLIIVFGIIDFGWLFYNQAALNNSCREGARFAVVNTGKTDRLTLIQTKVLAVSPASIKTGMTITTTYSNTSNMLLGDVTVTLVTNVKVLTPLLGVFTNNQQKSLDASVTMKVES